MLMFFIVTSCAICCAGGVAVGFVLASFHRPIDPVRQHERRMDAIAGLQQGGRR